MSTSSRPRSSRALLAEFRRELKRKTPDGHDAAPPDGEIDANATGDSSAAADNGAARSAAPRQRGYLRRYVATLRPFFGRIAVVMVLALSAAGLSLVLPGATMLIVDQIIPAGDAGRLHQYGLGLLAIILVHQTIDYFRNWRQQVLNAQIVFRIRQKLFRHMLHLPLHKLSAMKTGGITSRLSGDVDSVTGLVQSAFLSPGVAAAKVAATLAILLAINWKLSLAATLLLPGVIVLNLVYLRRVRPIYRAMRKDRGEIDARVVETFGGIRVVRGFRREQSEMRNYAVRHHGVIRKRLLAYFYECFVWSGWGLLIPLCALVVIWYGATLVLAGEATVGGLVAFQMYLMMLLSPVSTIVHSWGELQQSLAALERIFDVLAEPLDKPDRPGAKPAPARVTLMEFDAVSFAYRPDQPILSDISLRVPGGSRVALVGPSGAGKTTLTNLVARFYDPRAGAIRLNGVDLRDYQLRSFRRLLGIVQQDVFLFDGTVAENIAYGRPGAARAEIEAAARRANADGFIRGFVEGYDTLVGERGVRLSGGQAQRVSIARALLADPQILILDEATSSLDSESEQLIQAAMTELLRGRTTFVIAHRLSTVIHADLIVVLDGGRIAETGRHAELLERGGLYRAMVERQGSGALLDPAGLAAGAG